MWEVMYVKVGQLEYFYVTAPNADEAREKFREKSNLVITRIRRFR